MYPRSVSGPVHASLAFYKREAGTPRQAATAQRVTEALTYDSRLLLRLFLVTVCDGQSWPQLESTNTQATGHAWEGFS